MDFKAGLIAYGGVGVPVPGQLPPKCSLIGRGRVVLHLVALHLNKALHLQTFSYTSLIHALMWRL